VPELMKASGGNIRTLNATGDIEAIKDQFGKACKSCRDNFRIRDK
jgi:cytochrome c556